MINTTKEWIFKLQSVGQEFSEYSFFQELDLIINNQQSTQNDQIQFSKKIKELNDNQNTKINSKLEFFKSFEQFQECKDVLNNLTLKSEQQSIKSNPNVQQNINQNQEWKNLITKEIILQQQQDSSNFSFINNSIEQNDVCRAIVFDPTGKIMISTSGKHIKVWNFNNGMIIQTNLLEGHIETVNSLIYSQINNYFISGSDDNSIRMWKYWNNNKWQSSKPYDQHKEQISHIILTQKEDQLITCSADKSIKVWMVDFLNNGLNFQYSLDKHTSWVFSLSLNQSETVLVSCGYDRQIIIWKKVSNSQWKFQYVVNQSIKDFGYNIKFLSEDQFIWLPVNSSNLYLYECKDGGQYKENIQKRFQFKKDNKEFKDVWGFPIIYNKAKNLICIRHVKHIFLLKGQNDGLLSIFEELDTQDSNTYGTITNDGRYLVYWREDQKKYVLYEILYK